MTREEVREIVRSQAHDGLSLVNHGISLNDALVAPQKITVIFRDVKRGKIKDMGEDVWLVGQESATDGYRIVMRETDCQFGLASPGYPHDEHLVLTGWYGSLKSAFLAI